MRSRRMNEKDKLRAAVLAYDCFNEVMHGGRLGTYYTFYLIRARPKEYVIILFVYL